jgi:hypothetical protein
MLKRSAIFVHRWLGVALCVIFLLWFPSGIGMMYWGFPSVSEADRLQRSPPLDPSTVRLSPADAYARVGNQQPPAQVQLTTFDGRPVYVFRGFGGAAMIYADTGEEQIDVPDAMLARIASAWTGQPAGAATVAAVEHVDQWTIQGEFQNSSPLRKYSWPNGEQVYIAEHTGEVAQYTTTASRLGAYVGAIPHWLYFTPLRKHGLEWSRLVIWSSGIGTVSAIVGIVIGIWMYSPLKRYRYAGAATSIPYRGQKRWHTIFGLLFGVGAVTWAFSGMLSMDPFPVRTGGPAGGRDGNAGENIADALRGPAQLAAFAAKHPREALAQMADLQVKELELTSFAGEPVYLASLGGGGTRIIPLDGEPRTEFDRQRIIDAVGKAVETDGGAEFSVLEQYDRYYLDRRRQLPLPVILARLNDGDQARYYIDPKTARVVGDYNPRNWVNRWLYHGLHSLDFPWLYNYRPLWDIVVITFMVGGTALCVTSLILAWRVLGRTLRRLPIGAVREPSPSEDLLADR